MEGLTHEQMLEAKRKRLQEAGIPANAGMMSQHSVVQNSASGSALAKIQAIKNGAMQSDFEKFDRATGKNTPGVAGAASFDPIPEVKQRRNPNDKKVSDQKFSQKLESFNTPPTADSASGELAAIEAMFGGGGGSRAASVAPNGELNLDSIGPSFNPQAILAKKNANSIQETAEQAQTQSDGFNYAQYALGTTQVQEIPGVDRTQQLNSFNYQKEMMEQIAEQTVKNFVNELSDKKGIGLYTQYKGQKSIVQTPDGKIYQMIPLREGADGKLYKKKS